jgi:2-methylisocitrate lyase-like PEP mutase family enzyme
VTNKSQQAKANTLRELHEGPALVLPNAWDAGSAALIVRAGAKAVATTSGGVAWTQARPDGQQLTRAEMVDLVARIIRAVEVPVTADVEAGYGPTPEDVAATVTAVIDAGAVGMNLEDSTAPGGPLFGVAEQSERLRAGRAAAEQAGLPTFVINARTDVYLFQVGAPEGRFDDVVTRARAYAEAGADCLFVPGLVDLDVLRSLVKAVPLPVNVMTGAGGPDVADLETVGVQRISVGTGMTQAAYSVTLRAATELLTKGTHTELAAALDFGGIDSVFRREEESLP